MKKVIKMISTLVIISSISGAVLAIVYNTTKPRIEIQQKAEIERAIFDVIPKVKSYRKYILDNTEIYKCFNKTNQLVGLAFTAKGPGYQDTIKIMVGLNKDLSKITGIKILENSETPGLGGRINESWFQKQFANAPANRALKVVKKKPVKPNQIQAITGATISSNAVCDIINKKIKKIKQALNE